MKKLIAIILSICLLCSGCKQTDINNAPKVPLQSSGSALNANTTDITNAFNTLCNEIFLHMITADSITLNYNSSNPKQYGITNYTPTLGEYSTTSMYEDYSYYENKLTTLNNINRELLSETDKLTYDILQMTLNHYISSGEYIMFNEPLSPVTGFHAQLPVLLAEYHFYSVSDIDNYLQLLSLVPSYFDSIIAFEAERKANGIYMGIEQINEVISQCEEFTANPDENYLIDVFEDKIKQIEGITDEQIKQYSDQNSTLIKNSVIMAYNNLINKLRELSDESLKCAGLCMYPNGKKYYEKLLTSQTNSEKTPQEIFGLLESTLSNCRKSISAAITSNPDAYNEINKPSYISSEPTEILEYLTTAILPEFPALANGSDYSIKYVHESLENTLSPAMYITPPLDCDVTNSIYINKASCDASTIFTTLAHEGYPGHMYQTEYFLQTNPHPLRLMLNFGGYSEGWATYTELYSYDVSGISEAAATILKNNKLAMLCLYSIIDIGIHYYEWTMEDVKKLLNNNGISDTPVIEEIYFAVVTEPALYLKYTLGCLEFMELRKYAETMQGDKFDAVGFHNFILSTGPTWFSILQDRLETYVKSRN